jgi:hypothetical protein
VAIWLVGMLPLAEPGKKIVLAIVVAILLLVFLREFGLPYLAHGR